MVLLGGELKINGLILSGRFGVGKNWLGGRDVRVILYEMMSFSVQLLVDLADLMRSAIVTFESDSLIVGCVENSVCTHELLPDALMQVHVGFL
jgi:hypothetical protein